MLPLDHENAARLIKKKRKELGLRQSDLVDDTVKLHAIRKVEKGEIVSDDILIRICNKLALDPEHLSESYEDVRDGEEQLKFKLFAIEHDMDMVGPEEGLEELRKVDIDNDHPLQAWHLFLKGKYNDRKGHWKKAQAQYLKALSIINQYPELEMDNLKASTYNELGRCCYYQNDLEQALAYIEKGLEAYNPGGDRNYIVYHLKMSKTIYLEKLDRNEEAVRTLEEMWEDIGKIDSMEIRLIMYETHAQLLIKQELFEKAIEYATKAIRMARLDQNVDRSFELWTTLGESFKNSRDYNKAEICFRTALKLEKKVRKKNVLVSTYTKLGVLYLKTKKITLAQNALLKAVQLGQRTNDALKYCTALAALGDCYMLQEQTAEARQCFQQALTLAERHALNIHLPEILVKLAKCCERDDPATYETYKNRVFQFYVKYYAKGGDST
ncbi:helix-turn-helix domain-containing protein [Laceyella putida]|uniref:Helix-turn-helix domain-containing protein n=1 Tax=Laceyella putida TaxID=110101 RepID=A0ABW2RP09_9BACL